MSHNDYKVMAEWLSTPAVLEFFGDINAPFTLEQVQRKYGPRITGDVPIYPYIVELEKEPIGFIQYYRITREVQKEFGYQDTLHVYGIDQFIGAAQYHNQGLGTLMITKFLTNLYQQTGADIIVLDPDVSNARAIRCYEKCGFVKVKKVKGGTGWLMEIRTRSVAHEAAKGGNE
ncbi:GNAT family N-acetyltransferase [Planococcus soli]|uniref:GNAT family N-acetyltransferase n=1 Tax=Planococcus soli TaxID=2666072 RepID=UPI00115DF20C|nr:GNAT family N-acetyltransferase [Planococcus soli]